LSMDSSNGSRSVDRHQVEEAVRRWKSEHGNSSLTEGNLSKFEQAVSRRRSATIDGNNADSSVTSFPEGGGEKIRVVIRRAKSLDESSSSFMSSILASGEQTPRRASRRTSTTTPSARARSRSRDRRSSHALKGFILKEEDGDATEAYQVSPERPRRRSVSRGRRKNLGPSQLGEETAQPTRRLSRAGRRQSSSTTSQRSHSLGRHLEKSNHEADAKLRSNAMSCSRSVSAKSAGCESRQSSSSAPGRLITASSGSILQRRRGRSLSRCATRNTDEKSDKSSSRAPLPTQHPMNDLSRNHRNDTVGSPIFSSKISPPVVEPAFQDVDVELSRLVRDTGITLEQLQKLRDAGYMLTPGS
jgi:hypothetical protein